MSAAHWLGPRLFLGRIVIGKIERDTRDNSGKWLAFVFLPGARLALGDFPNEPAAKARVEASANSRVKAMFGAGMETTATAVSEGRKLRICARAIWRAGVWACDQPVNAFAMFADLGAALGMDPDTTPLANTEAKPGDYGRSDIEPPPEQEPEMMDMVERPERTAHGI